MENFLNRYKDHDPEINTSEQIHPEFLRIAKILFPFSRLLREVSPCASPITDLRKMEVPRLWANVVTKKDNGLWRTEPNDGIVTQASMRHRSDMELIDLDVNHYEVVVSPDSVNIISERIKSINLTKER